MRFTDRVALITAVASGIGRATADIMGREGAVIVGVDNNETRLEQAMEEIRAAGGRATGWVCDALDPQQVRQLVDAVAKEHGRIDILVNAVGGSTIIAKSGAAVHELSFEDWEKLIQFNLNGTFLFTNAVVPVMQRQGSGKIVNLASIAGRGRSVSSSAAYATAKGGIIAFTKKLSYELGPYGININAIAPSVTLTERIRPHWERRSQEAQAAEIDKTPLRRVAEAVDQARVICFLASEDADFVTGETIDVTGGGS
jgi:NAD(P)-dependent dehydrogenase (short-subunit alcohol dehydrogenase family)